MLVLITGINSLLVQPHVAETLRDIFMKLGGIPQKCFQAIFLNEKEHETQIIKQAINQISSLKDFVHSENGFLQFKSSHALLCIEPSDDIWIAPVIELLSDYVVRHMYNRFKLHQIREAHDSIDNPPWIPEAHHWSAKLFGMGVHHLFGKGIKFQSIAIYSEVPAISVQIKKANSETKGYFHSLSV